VRQGSTIELPHHILLLNYHGINQCHGNIIQQATRTSLPQQYKTGNLIFLKWYANLKRENSTYDHFCVPKLGVTISGIITFTCFHFVASAVD
jgi:hypothetical protein